jgi:hypothetical protein
MSEIELDFGAITIDNSTFKSEGYRFYEGLLAQMRQFKESPVQVIQTDIVHNEAIKHIGQEISRARSSIEQALRSANKQLKVKSSDIDKAKVLLSKDGTDYELAESHLDKYYEFIGAEKIKSGEYADLSELVDMYFNTEAPFETGKDKKNEFPDAIALLAIESWAEQNDLNIIAVSQDNGWKDFSAKSNRVTLVSSLAEALEKFQPHNKVSSIIGKIREDAILDSDNNVIEKIEEAIINSLDGIDIYVEADSSMFFDYDDVSASFISHDFDVDNEGLIKIRIVRIEDESIVLKLGSTVEVNVEANFDFSVRDSIDRDYVRMGSNICKTVENFHTDILLTMSGDFSQDIEDIEVVDIEVVETLKEVNFGEVEPDWRSHFDEEES